jgi:hypothetical protein
MCVTGIPADGSTHKHTDRNVCVTLRPDYKLERERPHLRGRGTAARSLPLQEMVARVPKDRREVRARYP